MIELKSCPFCGGSAELIFKSPVFGKGGTEIKCLTCKATIGDYNYSETHIDVENATVSTLVTLESISNCIERAVKAWNSRAVKTKHKPQSNADLIRSMTDEELSKEMLFFCPTDTVFNGEDTYQKPHYTGLAGKYYATSEEVVASNLKWLKQPADKGE